MTILNACTKNVSKLIEGTTYMSKQSYFKHFSLAYVRSWNIKTVLLQVIQFSITSQFSSIWAIDRTLSDATTPGQGWPKSNGNEVVLSIPQGSSILESRHLSV